MSIGEISAISGPIAVGLTFGQVLLRLSRRPRLTIERDEGNVHSRVEADGWPYIRLLVHNSRYSRGAKGARVLVESYRPPDRSLTERVTFGSPVLGWTSGGAEVAADGSLTLPPGVARTIDLGYLTTRALGRHAQRQSPSGSNQWGLQLGLHRLQITDGRDRIPYGRWIIRLIATADDASTRIYDVQIEWNPQAPTPEDELRTVVLSVTRV